METVLRILSICNQYHSDKGTDVSPDDCLFQEQTYVDETQENGSYNTQVEPAEHDHNISKKDLSQNVNTSPSVNFDAKSQDNIPANEDVEEGEISGGLSGTKSNSIIIPLSTEAVENGDVQARVINKTTRNLVDYSEIAVNAKSQESVMQATKKRDLVKDSGAQNTRKRQGSCSEEESRNKKSKNSVDRTTRPDYVALLGENASQEVVDATTNKDAPNEKKKKRALTQERKAKKKKKDRLKRAEKNRKLGIKRLTLQPVIKEKKITYCRHYMNGRCHEGEKCKFSHDTIPLTKSNPCCHFARHACMKGDDCPYDHDLSKYPCKNYQTKGSCNRGSDCMFSHEVLPSEDSLNESNKSKPEQKTPSNSGSKKVEAKSYLVPKFVDVTPKVDSAVKEITKMPLLNQDSKEKPKGPLVIHDSEKITRTPIVVPRGINFLSFGKKAGIESCSSPKVDSEVKEITKMPPLVQESEEKTKGPPVVHDFEEISQITKTPSVVPRGINFLSFGKKPGLDNSNSGYSFKISNRVEKPRISDVAGEGSRSVPTVSVVNEFKVDFLADKMSYSKNPIPMMSFMSSTSQKLLRSTLAFASELDSGLKSKV
ncbi:uncharacterized protein LOC143572047 [Bidens hawaiensis]|uniref:uncharacterized protein LOC143572047 n=1 Tax=Bidens hawaiensis TaxID=980011 RepID=UPI00404B6D8E